MAPASNEEQFKFLISCIRYSNNGKVDFGQVAKECSIVSKGAAAKRYERMMRAHGIASNAASIKPSPFSAAAASTRTAKPDRTPSSSLSTNARKRKADQFVEDPNPADDDEEFATPSNMKAEPRGGGGVFVKKQMCVKEESIIDGSGSRDRKSLVMGGHGHGHNTPPGLMGSEEAKAMLRFYTPAEDKEGLKNAGGEDYFDGGDHYSVPTAHSSIHGKEFARMGGANYGSSPSPSPTSRSNYGHSSGHATPTGSGYGMQSPRHQQYVYKHGYENGSSAYGASSGMNMGMGMGMGAMTHTSSPSQQQQQMGFHPSPYRAETKGRQESPLLVE